MSRAVGILLLVMFAPLALLVLTGPPSASGAAYVIGALALASALVAPFRMRRSVALAGAALLVFPAVFRTFNTWRAGDVRVMNRFIDERDVSVDAARAIARTHFLSDPDVPKLPDAMRVAYADMAREEGDLPSPVAATVLGLERAGASDAIELSPEGSADGRDAVVFLHGFAGNFTMPCWLFARAAARAGMTTVCPSTTWRGDWWNAGGEAIVRDVIASLRQRRRRRVFLAGLSNGAIGASRLAPRLHGEIAGLILVSGAAEGAGPPGVPTLVVQGEGDGLVDASEVHAYASRVGAQYTRLPGGHFAMVVDREHVAWVIAAWLAAHHS